MSAKAVKIFRILILGALALSGLNACSGARIHPSGRSGLLSERRAGEADDASRSVSSSAVKQAALAWPLREVKVTSSFGRRGKEFHEGVDLHAANGTSVYAAQAGRVLYADRRIKGYGSMVVIRHPGGVSTVYAHNSRL